MDERRELALRAAEAVARRTNDRQAQVRRIFVVSEGREIPPVAQLLRGGRGGMVRLKLYLSLLWFAAKAPYDVTYPARAWASLLELPQPGSAGARRISDALKWLAENDFVELQYQPGSPNRVVLLDESGAGLPYEVPGAVMRRTSNHPENQSIRERNRYLQVPPAFWTAGWCAELSGPGVAMLLVILAEHDSRTDAGVWFSPSVADRRYGLSPATRSKGIAELSRLGLVTIRKMSLAGADPFETQRSRNVYLLNRDAFGEGPLARQDAEQTF